MGLVATEPLAPETAALTGIAEELLASAPRLGRNLHPATLDAVAELLRTVNCHYSNRIEGHDTHPIDIERAMHAEAGAHIEVQLLIERRLAQSPGLNVCAAEFVRWIHCEFYGRLPRQQGVEPGELRHHDVTVGTRAAPGHAALPALLERFASAYDPARHAAGQSLVLAGAAFHRLLWIHPFGGGNSLVARLMTDAYLRRIGVGGHGLWTASRGLARRSAEYRTALAAADAPHWNDYHGRGELSHQALVDFARFFLEVCRDEVDYMGGLLQVDGLASRAEAYGKGREIGLLPAPDGGGAFRPEATRLLRNLVYRGAIPRNEVPALLNLEERTARRVVRTLADEGFIASDSTRAPIRLRIPAHAGAYLLPGV